MAKVTSKLQVTIPKALAEKYGIRPGDDVEWSASGDAVRLTPASTRREIDVRKRLQLFDAATERQRARERSFRPAEKSEGRGWTRQDLYERGRSR